MRRSDREITGRSEIDEIIEDCQVCHLAMASGGEPYVVPVSFGYDGSSIYFHSARHGRKIDFITANPRVCVQFERNVRLRSSGEYACDWTFSFESVIGFGTVEELHEPEQKRLGLNRIMRHYSGLEWGIRDADLDRTRVWRIGIESVTGKRSDPPK